MTKKSKENLKASLLIEDTQVPLVVKENVSVSSKPLIKVSFSNIEFEVEKKTRKWNQIGASSITT